MATTNLHAPGAPCWFELGTTDQAAAKTFYSSLFGWEVNDSEMGPGQTYTIFKVDGADVAAAYKMGPELAGIPPHWMVYFATPDVDASTKKVVELGGVVRMGPFDVMEHGRMSVVADPEGTTFSLWQGKDHKGAMRFDEINTVGWSELATRDPQKAIEFYTALLGWEVVTGKMPAYSEFKAGGLHRGGILTMDAQWEGIPSNWGIYVLVDNCDGKVEQAKALGGEVCHGPFDAPDVGRIAILKDPAGASLSVIQLFAK